MDYLKDVEGSKKLQDKPTIESGDVMESIIKEVGEMGRYQRWLFVAMFPFFMNFMFIYCVQMFIAATPQQHWCRVPELQELDIELRRNLSIPGAADGLGWDRCLVYDANWTLVQETMTVPNVTTKPCQHGWEYLYEDIPYVTIISERDWVCDRDGVAPLAQSMFFAGSLFGGIFFGWTGDKYGRLPTLIGANMVGFVGGILTVFTRSSWDFIIARFIVGLSNDACAMMMFLIVIEYVGPSHRTWVTNMSMALYGGGSSLLLVLLALAISNWRGLIIATSLPMLFALATPWFVPESAMWLASKGQVDKAVKMLKKFERVNKTKISEKSMNEFIVSAKLATDSPETMKHLFQSRKLRNVMLVVILVGMISNVSLDALIRMSETIGTNFFATFALSSAAEVPALIIVSLILDRWGRRAVISGSMALSSVFSVLSAIAGHGMLQLVLVIGVRFFSNMTIGAHFQLTSEVVPTGMRAGGNALVHLCLYVGIAASPYIVYSGRLWSPLPLHIVSLLCLVAAVLALLLPETKGRMIPQTIAEAEKLIDEGSLWSKKDKKSKEPLETNVELETMFKNKSPE